MKLVTYKDAGIAHLGIVSGEVVYDVKETCAAYQKVNSRQLDETIPDDMMAFLKADEAIWLLLRDAILWAERNNQTDAQYVMGLGSVRLCAPVLNPSKIICAGLNYYDHCREQNVRVPESPIFFSKFPSALIGPEASITWPPDASEQVDFEAELALVVRRKAYRISGSNANDFIAGYLILNDVSARDIQFSERQWTRAKSFDTFCPTGPYLVTVDEVPNPQNLDIKCWVNGTLMQDSNTREMIFSVPELLERLTRTCTLLPGDIISTGTPHGVGVFRDPKIFLKPGDTVETEIENLGKLRNSVGEWDPF